MAEMGLEEVCQAAPVEFSPQEAFGALLIAQKKSLPTSQAR